jgi:lipopolysaccharide transport system ATP-binding protein
LNFYAANEASAGDGLSILSREESKGNEESQRSGEVSDDTAIRVLKLSKRYQIYSRPQDRLKQSLIPRLQRFIGKPPTQYGHEFWALRDVSFEVRKGETVGIIGRNGSGKSTLLQMICGTLSPTVGNIHVDGRIAALLELGAGFNPDFTGRENVHMVASLYGLSRADIDARFDEVAAFADIGDFIEQPVKTYSSGMFVRLAFAVIAHVDADILVIDEALAVGDVFFSQKCMRFLAGFQERGGTILFVSHDTAAVTKLCSRVVLLSSGQIVAQGSAIDICNEYVRHIYLERGMETVSPTARSSSDAKAQDDGSKKTLQFLAPEQKQNPISVSPFNRDSASFGQGGARIVDAGFFDEHDARLSQVFGGQPVRFSIFATSSAKIRFPAVGFVLKDRLGQAVFAESTTLAFEKYYKRDGLEFQSGDAVRVDFSYLMPVLLEGNYALTLAVAEGYGHDHVQHHLMHEGLLLRSLGSRLLHGIAGVNNLKISISISR